MKTTLQGLTLFAALFVALPLLVFATPTRDALPLLPHPLSTLAAVTPSYTVEADGTIVQSWETPVMNVSDRRRWNSHGELDGDILPAMLRGFPPGSTYNSYRMEIVCDRTTKDDRYFVENRTSEPMPGQGGSSSLIPYIMALHPEPTYDNGGVFCYARSYSREWTLPPLAASDGGFDWAGPSGAEDGYQADEDPDDEPEEPGHYYNDLRRAAVWYGQHDFRMPWYNTPTVYQNFRDWPEAGSRWTGTVPPKPLGDPGGHGAQWPWGAWYTLRSKWTVRFIPN